MAQDVLVILVSIVASESAFSTSRRILNDYRCSTTPENVESLFCTQSWIRDASNLCESAYPMSAIVWLKPGAAVIDVGTNAVDVPSRKTGYRLVGDVDFDEAKKVAGWLTPLPGSVGPMTVAMLLKNTLEGAIRKMKI
ncbi:uncharacterized protein LOC116263607 [Nymphaea colorata]|nr:uncharacterized protein LOC116263607 [Nymphaea colorata]